MNTLIFVLSVLLGLSLLFLSMRRGFKSARDVVQFNLAGGGPMARLVPNISYTLLFVMILFLSL